MRQPLSLMRRLSGALLLGLSFTAGVAAASAPVLAQDVSEAGFQRFVQGLWPAAKARGVSRATFEEAFRGVEPDAKIIALTKKQSEFVRPIWDYINGAISAQRLKRGQEVAAEWSKTLAAVERTYGVPRQVVLGVWGMETNFGSFTGSIYAVRALATLAYTGYRGDFFKEELLTALQILEGGAYRPLQDAGLLGRRHGADPVHALELHEIRRRRQPRRVAGHLVVGARRHGLDRQLPALSTAGSRACPGASRWRCRRLRLPPPESRISPAGQAAGLRRIDGKAMPRAGEASLFLPGGADGPAFLVTRNYDVIKAYNSSDAYAMGVAHLGDRLLGGLPIQGAWPKDRPMLDRDQSQELQERLAGLGYYEGTRTASSGPRPGRPCGTSSSGAA